MKGWIIGLVIVIIAVGIWYFASGKNSTDTAQQTETPTASATPTTAAKGSVYFGVTDAAINLQNYSSIQIKVSKVELHSEAQGWMTISDQPKQYDLLALKSSGAIQLLGNAEVAADTYNQIRLMVDSVTVKDAKTGKTSDAKLPSGKLELVGRFVVDNNQSSSIVLDFLADQSLHITGTGQYIFAPVIKLDSKSRAQVQVSATSALQITGGTTDTSNTQGMDEKGTMGVGVQIDANANLDLTNGVIRIKTQ